MRSRLVLVSTILAVVLLAAACGGGDAAEESEDLPADAPAVSEVTTDTVDRSDTTESDPPEQAEQADSDADAEQAADSDPEQELQQVRLGNRFEWCVSTQAKWDALDGSLAALREAETQVRHAADAAATATDDLDRAEAQETLDANQRTLREAQERFDSAHWQALHNDVALAQRLHTDNRDDSRGVAYKRAWTAFIANTAPATAEAMSHLESEQASYDAAQAAVDAAVALAQTNLDAALAVEEEAFSAVEAAARDVNRAWNSGEEFFAKPDDEPWEASKAIVVGALKPPLGETAREAWEAGEGVVEAHRSTSDENVRAAVAAYDAASEALITSWARWYDTYDANQYDHEGLAAALAELYDARAEAITALAKIDVSASEAITEALSAFRAGGLVWAEAYTAKLAAEAVHRAAVAHTDAMVAAYDDTESQRRDIDYGSVRETQEALATELGQEILGGAAYSAFRASLQESCQP